MRKGELSSMTSMTSMTLPPLRKRISEAAAVSDQGVLVQGEVGIAAGLIQSTSGDAALLTIASNVSCGPAMRHSPSLFL